MDVEQMDRCPPQEVIRTLRREVGFGCPVPGCGNPYLTWHHFDPPWRERHHHEAKGMVALCPEHHNKADAGAFTPVQLRQFKSKGTDQRPQGRFDWRRQDLLAVVGGTYMWNVPCPIAQGERQLIWFNRDEEHNLLLNIQLPRQRNSHIPLVSDNVWMRLDAPQDVVCPPSGRKLEISYKNGDRFYVEFRSVNSAEELLHSFPRPRSDDVYRHLPGTAVEIHYVCPDLGVAFHPSHWELRTNKFWGGGLLENGLVGVYMEF
jgi:hypothetical protein